MLSSEVQGLLKLPQLHDPQAYETAIRELETEAETVEAQLGGWARRRETITATATDKELREIDDRMAAMRLQAERIGAALPTLRARLESAQEATARAAMEQRASDAKGTQKRGVALIKEYGTLAAKMVTVLDELEAGDAEIAALNQELRRLGMKELCVETAEAVARPAAAMPLYARIPFEDLRHRREDDIGQGAVQLPSALGYGPPLRGFGRAIPKPPNAAELEERREKEHRQRQRDDFLKRRPMPTQPGGIYDGAGRPDPQTQALLAKYSAELAAWQVRYADHLDSVGLHEEAEQERAAAGRAHEGLPLAHQPRVRSGRRRMAVSSVD